jgi:polyisoprenoid-binding protein YceI
VSVIESVKEIAPAGTWVADPAHSSVAFEVVHSGISSFRGGFADYEANLVGGEEPKLTGSARVASVTVSDENLTGHLQSPDFFDAQRFPEIGFEADEITRGTDGEVEARGSITIKGVTQPVELSGRINGPITDAYGNDRLGLRLETTIDRTQFGIVWNAPLPGGGNILADDVKLTADLSLVRKAA